MSAVDICSVLQIDDFIYNVPSAHDSEKFYEVNTLVGRCSCYSGQRGGFCKHQAFIKKHFEAEFPNCPAINSNDRYNFALLALSDECPPKQFFEVLNLYY